MADNNGQEVDLVINPIQKMTTSEDRYDHEIVNKIMNPQETPEETHNHLVSEEKGKFIGNVLSGLVEAKNIIDTGTAIAGTVIHMAEGDIKNSTKFISNAATAATAVGSVMVNEAIDLTTEAATNSTRYMLTTAGNLVDKADRTIDTGIALVQTGVLISGNDTVKRIVGTGTAIGQVVKDGIVSGIRTGITAGQIALDVGDAIRNPDKETNKISTGEPITQKTLTIPDHLVFGSPYVESELTEAPYPDTERTKTNDYFAKVSDHFTYDIHATEYGETSDHKESALYKDGSKKFSGSATIMDPDLETDEDKKKILEFGVNKYDEERFRHMSYGKKDTTVEKERSTPLSPLRPFVASDPVYAQKALFSSYNRTLLPIADAEFRKGFKHIMISRPECYIMWNGSGLSQQAEYDSDFNSAYSRMPHICELLSPSYIAGGRLEGTVGGGVLCNWNYLLSNMIASISSDYKTTISTKEGMTKSIEGHTVLPGGTLQSTQGGTLSITFRETKRLEVYECLKLWMLYIHKIRKGIFAPSYNGYMYTNSYLPATTVQADYPMYHPYDRALDYTCSIFENITNESMSQILYWDKWYGCYPIEATLNGIDSLSNAITGPLTVTAVFHYQYKPPACRNINLIEFNYNAGLVDHIGHQKQVNPDIVPNHVVSDNLNGIPNYIGPTDLFTGTPYIVMGKGSRNIIPKAYDNDSIWVPYLRFAHCTDPVINGYMNLSLTKSVNNSNDHLVTSS